LHRDPAEGELIYNRYTANVQNKKDMEDMIAENRNFNVG
jgi:hypothetical protein